MKLWRKLANKVTVVTQDGGTVRLTGRQVKFQNELLNGGKAQGSNLLLALVKRI